MLDTAILLPDTDAWPKGMKRPWTVEQIMAMPRERTVELRAQKKATGEPVHFFKGERCDCCGHVAPCLVSSGSCMIKVHRKNESDRIRRARKRGKGGNESTQRKGEQRKTLGFGYAGMPGGGHGNSMFRPDSEWAIYRPDDAARNKATRLVSKAKSRPGAKWVTAHMAHADWPLAPGVYVFGLEVWEDLVPVLSSVNRSQGNRLHDPADPTKATDRVFGLDEQHEQFVKPRLAIFAWDIVWVDGIIGGTAVGVRKERYRFAADGSVEYSGDIAAEAEAWDRAMVQLDLKAYADANGDVKKAARTRGLKLKAMRARLIEAGVEL